MAFPSHTLAAESQPQSEDFSGSCRGGFTGKTLAWQGREAGRELAVPPQPRLGTLRKQREDLEKGHPLKFPFLCLAGSTQGGSKPC